MFRWIHKRSQGPLVPLGRDVRTPAEGGKMVSKVSPWGTEWVSANKRRLPLLRAEGALQLVAWSLKTWKTVFFPVRNQRVPFFPLLHDHGDLHQLLDGSIIALKMFQVPASGARLPLPCCLIIKWLMGECVIGSAFLMNALKRGLERLSWLTEHSRKWARWDGLQGSLLLLSSPYTYSLSGLPTFYYFCDSTLVFLS